MSQVPDLGTAERIAVLRCNGLGDYLVAEPALAALRAAAPRAHITLLGGPWAAAALPGRPGPVDEVILVPVLAGVRDPRPGEVEDGAAVRQFLAAMRERHVDIALQLHGGGRNSNPVVLGMGAAFTAGLQAFDAPALDRAVSYQYWQHEVFRYLEVMAAIGAPAVRVQPRFEVTDADRSAAADILAGFGAGPVAVIHPGATDPRRRWPPERFGQVCDALAASGAGVAVIGTGEEQDVVAEVVAHSGSAVPLTGLSFSALVGLVAGAAVVVGNDSGPRHLAEAVGTATVGVYWCGNMVNAAPVGRGRHRTHTAWTVRCPECDESLVGEPFPGRCSDSVSLVQEVPVTDVVASALELLAQATDVVGAGT